MLDFLRLWRWLFPDRKQRMSQADLEDLDVSVQGPLTKIDQEKFVVKNGEVVGTTAVISADGGRRTNGKSLDGYIVIMRAILTSSVAPNFDPDKSNIRAASRATSLLMIEAVDSKGHLMWDFATAFFISPNLLLTAGHAALDPDGAVRTERYLFIPGTPFLNWDQVSSRNPWAIRCTVVENLYRVGGSRSKAIALLSSGNFESQNYVSLSAKRIPQGGTIDIIGYPGEKRITWLREKHQGLKSLEESGAAGEELLPTRRLVVTRGVVAHNSGYLTSYNLSTCPGLSGSCVLFDGKVYGTTPLHSALTL